ncbi:MAG: PDDEXK nuclease domain-containing protein [Kiritimatiellae bacterium]|nr:PDDEXK nuclease domain-containing protein [Kiritimatiellia bacterium]
MEIDKNDSLPSRLNGLLSDARAIIDEARANAVRSVDFNRVMMYWNLGRRIFEEEQQGKNRAEYGAKMLQKLAAALVPDYGSGFSYRQLAFSRQFYRVYPIVNALRSQLNWTQYRLLIQLDDPRKREYYELESVNNCWTARETERQIHSQLWERLLLSNDKEAVLAVARKERLPEKPQEVIKDPMRLEFLGLERKAHYYESDLEQAIIDHLQEYMMELGNGFLFSARQRRIMIEDDEFFVDLVFYNRLLKCFILIELKTGRLTHQDLGQLQMYVNYYDRKEKTPDENRTIGILLCSNKNDSLVKMSLPEDNKTILASEYKLYLPTEESLLKELSKAQEEYEAAQSDAEE